MSKEFYELDETIIKNPEDLDYNRMIEATKEVIKDISDLGKVLVISRGASAILKEKENVLRVFFIANQDDRIKRAKSMHNLENDQDAVELLRHADHAQNDYFMKAFNLDFDDQSMYHLILNTSNLDPEECSNIILNIVNNKLTLNKG